MEKFFTRLPLFMVAISEGIRFWINKPSKLKLRAEYVEISIHNKLTFIHLSYWGKKYENWYPCVIVIKNEKQEIDFRLATPFLFGNEYKGSWYIGIVLFSLPIVVLCLPYIAAARLYYKTLEKIYGFSRYSRAILKALKGQLNPDTEKLLITAMANSWQRGQFMDKKLTFKEAQNFLSEHRLVKQLYTSKIETGSTYFWYDNEDNMVAQTPYRNNNKIDDDFYILVLDAVFTEEKAKALLKCYKTMEITTIDIE